MLAWGEESQSPLLTEDRLLDEWGEAMLNDTSPGGGIQQMEDHYKTFIVRLTSLRRDRRLLTIV